MHPTPIIIVPPFVLENAEIVSIILFSCEGEDFHSKISDSAAPIKFSIVTNFTSFLPIKINLPINQSANQNKKQNQKIFRLSQ